MLLSMFIVLYLFLGGCAAGLLLVASVQSLIFCARKSKMQAKVMGIWRAPWPFKFCHANSCWTDLRWEETHLFERYIGQCYAAALVLTTASCTCLVFDLGNPRKALLLFTHPTPTPISIGAYVLAFTLVLLAVLCFVAFFKRHNTSVTSFAARWGAVLGVPCALALMSYTGVFLALVDSVPLWHTPLTVVLFVLSALSAGYALSSLIQGLSSEGAWLPAFRLASHKGHAVVIATELCTLALFVAQALFRPEVAVRRSLQLIVDGPLLGWLVGGVCVLGLLAPLVTEIILASAERRERPAGQRVFCLPADFACLVGCFLLRYCLVAAGMH